MGHDLNKMSGLLRAAVEDVQAAESAGYGIDMTSWWERYEKGYCTVCMAGAMLATGRFEEPLPKEGPSRSYYRLPIEIRTRMCVVDHMRIGRFESATKELHGEYRRDDDEQYSDLFDAARAVLGVANPYDDDDSDERDMGEFFAAPHKYLEVAVLLESKGL